MQVVVNFGSVLEVTATAATVRARAVVLRAREGLRDEADGLERVAAQLIAAAKQAEEQEAKASS